MEYQYTMLTPPCLSKQEIEFKLSQTNIQSGLLQSPHRNAGSLTYTVSMQTIQDAELSPLKQAGLWALPDTTIQGCFTKRVRQAGEQGVARPIISIRIQSPVEGNIMFQDRNGSDVKINASTSNSEAQYLMKKLELEKGAIKINNLTYPQNLDSNASSLHASHKGESGQKQLRMGKIMKRIHTSYKENSINYNLETIKKRIAQRRSDDEISDAKVKKSNPALNKIDPQLEEKVMKRKKNSCNLKCRNKQYVDFLYREAESSEKITRNNSEYQAYNRYRKPTNTSGKNVHKSLNSKVKTQPPSKFSTLKTQPKQKSLKSLSKPFITLQAYLKNQSKAQKKQKQIKKPLNFSQSEKKHLNRHIPLKMNDCISLIALKANLTDRNMKNESAIRLKNRVKSLQSETHYDAPIKKGTQHNNEEVEVVMSNAKLNKNKRIKMLIEKYHF